MQEIDQGQNKKELSAASTAAEPKKDYLKPVIMGLIATAFLVAVFSAGMAVGERKAEFSFRWAEEYHRNFAGPREGFFVAWKQPPAGEFINAHGLFGQIIKIEGNTLVIKGADNVENIVLAGDNTVVGGLRESMKVSELKVDDFVVVIGMPNDSGQIQAKLIRLLPPPPGQTSFVPFQPISIP